MIKNNVFRSLTALIFMLFFPGAIFPQNLQKLAEAELPNLTSLYKEFHASPEVSYFEKNTSARFARELEAAGFEVTYPVGKYPDNTHICYGVVGILRNGPGPVTLVRTDMDALPVEEKTGVPYASRVRMKDITGDEIPVMHACGHDLHMTILLGAAKVLFRIKDRWRGTLIMIGQPAEERGGGARAMLAGGLYERWPVPDFALAGHVDPSLEAGQVGYCPGYAMASVDMLDIIIKGIGTHGAAPHLGRDPIVISAQVINALQTIVSREINPVEPAVVTVGSIHGGTKHNIIPEEVRMQLTVRAFNKDVREQILKAIERITVNTARAAGVPEDRLPVVTGSLEANPALYNDPGLVDSTVKAFRAELGEEKVKREEPQTVGEDFTEYGLTGNKVPIFMFRVGTSEPGSDTSKRPILHSPYYIPVLEQSVSNGIRAMAAAVINLMKK
jgi:hippurate hydrolase